MVHYTDVVHHSTASDLLWRPGGGVFKAICPPLVRPLTEKSPGAGLLRVPLLKADVKVWRQSYGPDILPMA
jgi:hypothetical protein